MKLVILALFACSLLLLGCAGTPAPSQPSANGQQPPAGSNQQAANTGGQAQGGNTAPPANPGQAPVQPAAPAPAQDYTCALTLTPGTITAGGASDIGYSVSAQSDHNFTFNCGDEIREISTGGLTTGTRLCTFNTAGNIAVWIKADGNVCAQKTLVVLPREQGESCNVTLTSRDDSTHTYKFRVNFKGFAPTDSILWICDYTGTTKKIGGSETGQWLYQDLYCDYVSTPVMDTINVSIAGVDCGTISTR